MPENDTSNQMLSGVYQNASERRATIQPLLDAYDRDEKCRIKALFYHDATGTTHARQLFQTFKHGLQALSVLGPLTGADRDELERSLQSNRSLRYFRCGVPHDQFDARRRFDSLGSERICQTDRSKAATYTFLSVCRDHKRLVTLPSHCVRSVVEYAATPARRRMGWHRDF